MRHDEQTARRKVELISKKHVYGTKLGSNTGISVTHTTPPSLSYMHVCGYFVIEVFSGSYIIIGRPHRKRAEINSSSTGRQHTPQKLHAYVPTGTSTSIVLVLVLLLVTTTSIVLVLD